MTEAFICDAVRTPIGRFRGGLKEVRADDLAALPLKAAEVILFIPPARTVKSPEILSPTGYSLVPI